MCSQRSARQRQRAHRPWDQRGHDWGAFVHRYAGAEVFRAYVEPVLGPTLKPGDVVVMDNLRAHKVTAVGEVIGACRAEVVYLPPYSSDLSPIEVCWSKLRGFAGCEGSHL